MDSLLDPHKLIPTTELIRLAMSEGLYVGSGDPANYVRYLTKVGLLPPARRLGFNGGNYTVGHYPKSSLDSLRQISGLVRSGWTIQQIVDQGTPTDIPTTDLISRARLQGIYLGSGDPVNYIRYLTKLGILPNAQRQTVNGSANTVGHYPISALETLKDVERRLRSGETVQQIAQAEGAASWFTTDLAQPEPIKPALITHPVSNQVSSIDNRQIVVTDNKLSKRTWLPSKPILLASAGFVSMGVLIMSIPIYLSGRGAGELSQQVLTTLNLIPATGSTTLDAQTSYKQEADQNFRIKNVEDTTKVVALATQDLTTQNQSVKDIALEARATANAGVTSLDSSTQNEIQNSSFELNNSGAPDGWQYINLSDSTNSFVSQDCSRTGQNAIKFILTGVNAGGIKQSQTLTRSEIDPALSAWVKGVGLSSNGYIRIGLKDASGKFVSKQDYFLSGTFDWQRLTLSASAIGAYPAIEFKGYTKGVACVDDWQVTEGSVQVRYNQTNLLAQGTISASGHAELFPIVDGKGSLGTPLNRFGALYLTAASIDKSGNATIGGTVTSKDIQPSKDLTYNIGTPTLRYKTIFADSVVTSGSGGGSGDFTVGGNLTVTGTSHLIGNVTIDNNLFAPPAGTVGYWSRSGTTLSPSNIGDNVSTTGSITGATLTTTGNASIGGTLTVTGASTLNNTLNVTGTTTLADLVSSGQIKLTGNAADRLLIQPTVNPGTSTKLFEIKNALGTEQASISSDGNLHIVGIGAIDGAATISGLLSANGGIATNNAAINAGTGSISGGSITGATLTTTGNTSVGGNLNFTGATSSIAVTTAATPLNIDAGTSGAVNIAGISTGDVNLAGGSGSTGCTVTNSNGNFTCTGNILGNSAGTVGYWSRSGTTLSPATSGDNVTTSGNISTTGTGVITSAGLLTSSNGLTQTTGALNLTATSGALTLSGLGASSISTGANALTVTATNFNTTATGINSSAIGSTTRGTGAFTTLAANSTVNFSGLGVAGTAPLCLNGTNVETCTTGSSTATLQSAYNNGNTITTTDARNISITLADTATDQSLTLTQQGTATALILNDTNAGTNNAIDIQSGAVSKLTITELGTLSTSGNISTTGTGVITSAGLLTASNGLTQTTGALNLTATSGALTLSGLSASSLSTGANALTITSSNFNTTATGINSTAIGATTTSTAAFTTLAASSTVTFSGLLANSGTALCLNGTTVVTCTAGSSSATLQSAYNAGNTITTTDARNIALTFADTATDQSLTLTQQGTATALILNDTNAATDLALDIQSGGVSKLTINELGTLSTSGNISTTGSGTITSAGLLTASNGLTLTTGALNLTATSGALSLSGLAASSINAGANALTFTSSNFNTTATGINSTAIGATTASTGAFTTLTSSGSSTIGTGSSTVNTIGSTTTPGTLTLHGATTLDNTLTVSGANLTTLGGNLTFSGANPNISASTANTNLTVNANGTGTITLGSVSTGNIGFFNVANNFITSAGNLTLAGDITLTAGGTISSTANADIIINAGSGAVKIGPTGTGKLTVGILDPYIVANTGTVQSALEFQTAATAGADDFVFEPAGVEKIRFTEAGNISLTGASPSISLATLNATLNLDANGTGTINIGSVSTGDVLIGGGSGSTGCSVTNSNGNFTCSGNITGSATGTVGYWTRSGTTLSTATAGDNVTSSGNISTTGSGTITSAGLLTGFGGLTVSGGTANINSSGISNTVIGNATGTFSLASNGGLNVTTTGAVTGVSSISLTTANPGGASLTNSTLTLQSFGAVFIDTATAQSDRSIWIGNSNASVINLARSGVVTNILGSGTVAGNFTPSVNNADDLGSSTLAFRTAYLATSEVFKGTSFNTTLGFVQPTAARTVNLPDEGGTVCLQNSANCGFALSSGGTFLAKNAHDTSSASYLGNLYDFTNTNTGAAGVLSLTNSGTNSALSVTQSGNAAAGQALILANNSNVSPSGNLLDLQAGGVSKFSVTSGGATSQAGNHTFTGASPSIATTSNADLIINAGSGAVKIGPTGTGKLTVGILDPYIVSNTGTVQSALEFQTAATAGADDFVFETGGTTERVRIFEGGNVNLVSGDILTASTSRLTNAGALQNITGYTQTSGNFSASASTGTFDTSTGLVGLNGSTTLAANKNFTIATGTGIFTQTYQSTGSNAVFLDVTNTGSSGSNTVHAARIALTGTNNGTGANTINGIFFPNISAFTNNSFYALNLGTGFTDALRVGGAQIINGTGVLQSAGFSGTYSNAVTLSNGTNVISTNNLTATGGTINGTSVGATTASTGAFSTLSSSGLASLNGGASITCTGCITDSNVVDALTISGGTINNTPIGATITSTGAFTTLSASGLISANGGITLGANQNLTYTVGTGSETQNYTSTGGDAKFLNVTNSASSGTTTVNTLRIALTGTANGTGSNNINALLIPNITPQTNNTFNGLNFGTGLSSVLVVGGTQIVDGSGILKSAGLSGTYSNALTLSSSSNSITAGTLTATGGTINGTTIGQSTAGAGSFTTLSATSNASLSGGATITCTGCITDTNVVDALTISGGTVNNTPVGATTASTGSFTTLAASGLISANAGLFVAANQNLALSSGTGIYTQTYVNTSGTAATYNVTNSASSGTTTVNSQQINLTGTANGTGSNTINGFLLTNITPQTNNTFNALNFGTGLTNTLVVGGTTIINGTGVLQSTGLSGTYSNALTLSNSANFITAGTLTAIGGTINGTSVGATTASTGAFTTLSASSTTTLSGGATITCTACITDANVVDALTISGGTINNTPIGATTTSTGAFTTLSASGLISANGGLTLAANQNLVLTSGTGTYTQTYVNTGGNAVTVNTTNSGSSGSNTVSTISIPLTGTANGTGSNTLNAVFLPNITAQTNNTFNALNFGTGLTNTLIVGGTTILNGTGVLQSAGLSGTYSNALTLSSASNSITAGTLTATGGTINGTSVGATTTSTGAFTTLSASGASTLSGGLTLTCTACITDANVVDALTISGGTINNTTIGATTASTGAFTTISASGQITSTVSTGSAPFVVASTTNVANLNASSLNGATFAAPGPIGSTTASTGAFTTLSASGLISANGGLTLAANQNLTLTSGTGIITQTFSNTSGNAAAQTVTNTSSAAGTVSGLSIALVGSGTSATTNGIILPNVTPVAGNVFNGINLGTGLNSALIVGGTTILNGTGVLQSAGLSGTYSNALTLSSASNSITVGTLTATGGTINGTSVGATTTSTGAFTTLSATGASTLSGGLTLTCTACITDTNVVDALTISGGTINNTSIGATTTSTGAFTTIAASGQITSTVATGSAPFVVASTTNVANLNASSLNGATFAAPGPIGSTTPGTGAFTTLSASGLISANGGLTLAANQNLTFTSGTGTEAQTYVNTTGNAKTLSVTDSASTGTTTVNGVQLALVGTANGTGTNTINGLQLPNITAQTNNTFNALNFGTGLTNTLIVGGTTILNGTGVLQSAGLSGTYSNALTLSSASNSITAGTLTATGGTINGTSVGATTTSTGAFTTLSASGATNLSGGLTLTCTACITDANVVDALTISGGTINNTPIGATTANTGAFTTISASGLISANGGLTLAANQNLTLTSGTGIITQGYSSGVAGTGDTRTVTNSNAGATLTTVSGLGINLIGTTNANASANTIVGISFGNVTTLANNSFYGLNFGTGLTDVLRVNGAQILSGTGVLQSAGLSGTYSNSVTLSNAANSITAGTLTATGGTINGTSVGATTTANGAFTTLSASGLLSANGGLTLAANQNLTMLSGTGIFSQTFSGTPTSSAQLLTYTYNGVGGSPVVHQLSVTNSPSTTLDALSLIKATVTDGGTLANTVRGLDIDVTTANVNDTTYAAILQGGNVGIGTTTPAFALDVVGTLRAKGGGLYATQSSPADTLIADNLSSGAARIITNAAVNLALGTNSSITQLVLQNGGNVGIGTANPSLGKLQILGPANRSNLALQAGNSGEAAAWVNYYNNAGTLTWQQGPGLDLASTASFGLADNTSGKIPFFISTADDVRIGNTYSSATLAALASGKVGINNITPGNTLSLNTPNTADSLAQELIYTNAATNKGLVVQGFSGQSANLSEWQDRLGSILANITAKGSIFNIGGHSVTALAVPAAPTVVVIGTAGTTTWAYTVTATSAIGETTASTATSVTTGNAILSGTNLNRITWTAVTGAVTYKVYRTTAGGTPASTGLIATINDPTVTFDDTGVAGSGASPTINSSGDILLKNSAGTVQFQAKSNGDVIVGAGGVGKITVTTFDPLYNIGGVRYSTYSPSMIGVNEEITGTVATTYDPIKGVYSSIIDIGGANNGSDLWVFGKVTDPNLNLTSVLVSGGNGKSWYVKDGSLRKITIYSDRGGEVSYRLTAPRFDHLDWTTLSSDQVTEGYHVPDAVLTTQPGSTVLNEDINSGAYTENYQTTDGSIARGDVVSVSKTATSPSVIKSAGGYDAQLSGVAITNSAGVVSVAPAGRVSVKVSVENGAISSGDHLTSSATKPGYAMRSAQAGRTLGTALQGASVDGVVLVAVGPSWFDPNAVVYNPNGTTSGTATTSTGTFTILTATIGTITTANITNLNIGSTKIFADASGNLKIDGSVIITGKAQLADLRVIGVLTLNGVIDAPNGLSVKLGATKEFAITDASGSAKLRISDQGEVAGKSVAVEEVRIATSSATITPATTTTPETYDFGSSTVGSGTFKLGTTQLIIKSTKLALGSKIFVSFSGNYAPATRYWTDGVISETSFVLRLDEASSTDVPFNWWIVN